MKTKKYYIVNGLDKNNNIINIKLTEKEYKNIFLESKKNIRKKDFLNHCKKIKNN